MFPFVYSVGQENDVTDASSISQDNKREREREREEKRKTLTINKENIFLCFSTSFFLLRDLNLEAYTFTKLTNTNRDLINKKRISQVKKTIRSLK